MGSGLSEKKWLLLTPDDMEIYVSLGTATLYLATTKDATHA